MKKIFYIVLLLLNIFIVYKINKYTQQTQKVACKVLYMDDLKYSQGTYYGKIVYKVLDDSNRIATIFSNANDYADRKPGDIVILHVKRYEFADGVNPTPIVICLLLLINFILIKTFKQTKK